MSRLTLAQQLKQLQEDVPTSADPESAYTSLDTVQSRNTGTEGREHYLDVGPSKMRASRDDFGQTLLSDKYAGQSRGRVKIFDDDDEDEDEDSGNNGQNGNDYGSDEDDDEDEDENDDEDEDDSEDEEEGGEDEEGPSEEEDEIEAGQAVARGKGAIQQSSVSATRSTPQALDPLGSLRESRQKDVEKGRGIKRQKVSSYLTDTDRRLCSTLWSLCG